MASRTLESDPSDPFSHEEPQVAPQTLFGRGRARSVSLGQRRPPHAAPSWTSDGERGGPGSRERGLHGEGGARRRLRGRGGLDYEIETQERPIGTSSVMSESWSRRMRSALRRGTLSSVASRRETCPSMQSAGPSWSCRPASSLSWRKRKSHRQDSSPASHHSLVGTVCIRQGRSHGALERTRLRPRPPHDGRCLPARRGRPACLLTSMRLSTT